MKRTRLGTTDLTVSEVGFGAIPIIRLDRQEAIRVLRHAFERGITFFDTANAYHDSEEKIGHAFGRYCIPLDSMQAFSAPRPDGAGPVAAAGRDRCRPGR
jgi:aryl-alcohol dehydrogenase-like predicted oxidoreductase